MKNINTKTYALYLLLLGSMFFQYNAQALVSFRKFESLNPVPGCTTGVIENDSALVLRLINAYQKSDNEMHRGDSMWQYIFNNSHMAIHQVFKNGQLNAATDILRYPAKTDLFYGIDNLSSSFMYVYQNPDVPINVARENLDKLMRFAEGIGALPLDNPEENFGPAISYDAETVVKLIEQTINLDLSFPNPYPYEYGVLTSKGVISYRVPQALYQAWKIKQLVKNVKNPRVLEIGAGLGRTAYYAKLFGIQDYTIIDLPMTALCSGYFLGRSLGDEFVVLYGENLEDSENKVKILTPNDFLNGTKNYDLIINVDSMTEMDPTMAKAYFEKIRASTKTFLSINHEINLFTVADLIRECNSVLETSRHPYWLRQGYVEELVRFK